MRTLFLKFYHIFDDVFGMSTIFNYAVIGGLSAAICFSTFAIQWDFFHISYKIATTTSYTLAILFNFISNRRVTFKRSGKNLSSHIYRYLTMVILNYGITIGMVHGTVKFLALSPYIGLLSAIVVTTITGFTLSKYWVFNK